MRQIEVRAKAGRVARTAPDGDFIPDDRFVKVTETPYIKRLLNHHGDIEERPKKAVPNPPTTKPADTADKKEA